MEQLNPVWKPIAEKIEKIHSNLIGIGYVNDDYILDDTYIEMHNCIAQTFHTHNNDKQAENHRL